MIRFCKPIRRSINISPSPGRPGLGAGVFTVLFLKDTSQRADIETVAAQLRKACSEIPGIFPTLNPQPVLQINIGATGSSFGRYSYVLSGINPAEVYAAADKLEAKLRDYHGFASPPRSDLFRNTPNLDINIERDRAGLYGVSTTNLEKPAPRRLFAELRLSDQASRRSISGDCGSRRRGSLRPGGFSTDLRQARQRHQTHSDPRPNEHKGNVRPAIGQSHQSIHQRDLRLRYQTGRRARRRDRLHQTRRRRKFCRRP